MGARLQDAMNNIKDLEVIKRQIKELQAKLDELEHIWLFFQRFADEQGNDKIKICRAVYPTVLQKLNAMEWLARYIEFITPDAIALAANYIKEHYADPKSKVT